FAVVEFESYLHISFPSSFRRCGRRVGAARGLNKGEGQSGQHNTFHHRWYCSSLTFSIQSEFLPSSCSTMAMCVIAVVGAAPCQCFSLGGNQTTSPGRISSIDPSHRCARPQPAVTISVWPKG